MGRVSATQCDGRDCKVIETTEPHKSFPVGWLIISASVSGSGVKQQKTFHSVECAIDWLGMGQHPWGSRKGAGE
jgi:hypothetical protein